MSKVIGPKVIMADGSLLDDESISWWYEEDGEGNIIGKELAYVMDFTKSFPYWEELKAPEGFNHVVQIGEVWHWSVKEDKKIQYPFQFRSDQNPEVSDTTTAP
jgi:hypothetical protein